MNDRVEKRELQSPAGFVDWSPAEAIALERMVDVIRRVYALAGYSPLNTPLVERPAILLAKAEGEVKNQIYGLRLMNPASDSPTDEKQLALRFDHTVPLVRYVVARQGEIQFPFRRYVIGPVVRGERPKEGRYREFIQADVDVIGQDALSLEHDAEMVSIIVRVLDELAFGPFLIRISNRKVLAGLLMLAGCRSEDQAEKVRRAIDAIEKVGRDLTIARLTESGIELEKSHTLLELLTKQYGVAEAFAMLEANAQKGGSVLAEGVAELKQVIEGVRLLGIPEDRYVIDPSLARGLDYYTGTVFEARLTNYPQLGSIAGGGRYDKLAENFSNRQLPGVGVSIGVTRLLRRLIREGIVRTEVRSSASVLVASADIDTDRARCMQRAQRLRDAGIATEAYLQPRKLGPQLAFAAKRGMRAVVFTQVVEGALTDAVVIRDMQNGAQTVVEEGQIIDTVRALLG